MLDLTKPLQNGTQWQIELCRDDGTRLLIIDNPSSFWTTRTVNAVGGWEITLPGDFSKNWIAKDRRVKFWRKPDGGAMYQEFQGLLRRWRYAEDEGGNLTRVIGGASLNYLVSGRVVAYKATTTQAYKTSQADNMLKALALENLGASAGTDRVLAASLFTISANVSLAPSVTKGMSYRNLLDVFRELCSTARLLGTELYFDMVPTGDLSFELRTFTGQRGIDRSGAGGLIFSRKNGNLLKPVLEYDASAEVTNVYGLGGGEGTARDVQPAQDTARMQASLLARREDTVEASSDPSAAVLAKAQAKVMEGRPQARFGGTLQSVPGSLYGKDWGFGDKLRASFDGQEFVIMARSVTCAVNGQGKESVTSMTEAYV